MIIGIITNAQNASIMQSIAELQEYFSEYYVSNFDDIENLGLENKAEALSTYPKSKKWFYKPSDDGYGNLNYIVDASGNAYFLLNKKEFLKSNKDFDLRGGDAGSGTYADYNELNDVYGLNGRLEVYYITKNSDGSLNIMGTQSIDKDNPNRTVFATGSSYANFVSTMVPNPDIDGNGEISASEAATIDTIEITSTHFMELDELYNFPALKTLKLQDIELDSLDGLKNLRLLEYLSFTNVTVTEGGSFAGIKANTRLNYLYVLQTNDNFVKSLFTQMKEVTYSKLEYIGIYDNVINITNTSLNLMADFQSGTKTAVKKLYFYNNNLSDIEFLSGYTQLELISVEGNTQLASLSGLNSVRLDAVYATNCNLGVNESLYDITKNDNGMNKTDDALSFLQICTNVKTLYVETNKIKWLSYINYISGQISYLRLAGITTFNQGEVASIKKKYNNANYKNINEEYNKFLNESDLYNFSRDVNSTTIASLEDDSEEIVSIYNLSQDDKDLIKILNLSGNNLLSSDAIESLITGKSLDASGNIVDKGALRNLFYINLNNTQIDSLDFLEYVPKLHMLCAASSQIGNEPDEGSQYCSEWAKIDEYGKNIECFYLNQNTINIEDVDECIVRYIKELHYDSWYTKAINNSYARGNIPASLVMQFGQLGTRMPESFVTTDLNSPKDKNGKNIWIDLSSCTTLKNYSVYCSCWFIMPSSFEKINTIQNNDGRLDLSNVTKNLGWIAANNQSADCLRAYTKEFLDNGIQIEQFQFGNGDGRDVGDCLIYLKNSGVKIINSYGEGKHWGTNKGTIICNFNDDDETEDIVEFGNLTNLTLRYFKNFDTSCVKKCTSLKKLELDHDEINTTSNFINLTNITYLNLDGNSISTLDGLANMSNLVELHLDTNNLTLAALNTLKDLHENGSLTKLYITNNSTLDKTKIKSLLVDSEVEWEVLEYDKD